MNRKNKNRNTSSSLVSFLKWQLRGFIFVAQAYVFIMFVLMPVLAWLIRGEWHFASTLIMLKILRVSLVVGVTYGAGNWFLERLESSS